MNQESFKLLDAAVAAGYITGRQADALRDELEMFPGQNVGTLMLRRNMLSPQQLQMLKGDSEPATQPLPPPPPPPPPPAGARPSSGIPSRPLGTAPPPPAPAIRPGSAPAPAPTPGSRPAPPPSAAVRPDSRPAPTAPIKTLTIEATPPKPPASPSPTLVDYLRMARACGASDLHICTDRPPFVRQAGRIIYIDAAPLTAEQSKSINFGQLAPHDRDRLERDQQIDTMLVIDGLGRHRGNIFKSRVGWEGAYRLIRNKVPTLDELGLPEVCKKLTEYHQGMVLVTGPCSSGKTTTVAALLDHVNRVRTDHIITVEDPVEFVIPPASCQITQRQVGSHTESFANALRAALRQDPDVIMVGELRDLETTSIAISAAETGHLVFGTLHTNTAIRAVARLMDLYPPNQRAQICIMVSESIRGVIAQQLIPRRDGNGVALAPEVLVFYSGVSAVIREGKTNQLPSLMQSGKRYGMKMMDESIMDLYKAKIISGYDAWLRSDNKASFEQIKNDR